MKKNKGKDETEKKNKKHTQKTGRRKANKP